MGAWLSRLLVVNGCVDLLLAFQLLALGGKLRVLFPALPPTAVSAFGRRASGWLVAAFGVCRLIAARYDRSAAGIAAGLASFVGEAAWLSSEYYTGNGLSTATMIYLLALSTYLARRLQQTLKSAKMQSSSALPRCLPAGASFSTFKRLFFIRHGETYHNLACTDANGKQGILLKGGPGGSMSTQQQDYVDSELTNKGKKQAHDAGLLLKDRGIQLVVVSPLERTLQTAEHMFPSPPGGKFYAFEGVREQIIAGIPYNQHTPIPSKRSAHPLVDFSLLEQDEDVRYEHVSTHGNRLPIINLRGERSKDVQARVRPLLEWLKTRPEQCVAVVCHGLVLRSLFGASKLRSDGLFRVEERDVPEVSMSLSDLKNCACHEVVVSF